MFKYNYIQVLTITPRTTSLHKNTIINNAGTQFNYQSNVQQSSLSEEYESIFRSIEFC